MPVIAALQATGRPGQVIENLALLEKYLAESADHGADILVTPELFVTGYDPATCHGSDGAAIRKQLGNLAQTFKVAIVASTVLHSQGRQYICASFFDASGTELSRYRKSHLFGEAEKSSFSPGEERPKVFSYLDLNIALGICYDIEFPEFARDAARRGADLLCIPTAVPSTGDVGGRSSELTYNAERISTILVPARALENGLYIVYANHTQEDFTGLSCIVSPYGTFLAQASFCEELIIADLDSSEVVRARQLNTYLSCARTDLYG